MNKRLTAVAVAGLLMLSGCGGGGGGGSTSTSASSLTVGAGQGTTIVTATPVGTSMPCAASESTNSAGQYILPISACGGQSLTITAYNGTGTSGTGSGNASASSPTGNVVGINTYVPGQSTTIPVNPSTSAQIAQYAGTWTATYQSSQAGGDSGSCPSVSVSATGVVTATDCVSSKTGSFTLTGGLNASGVFLGTASTGATYSGTFDATTQPPSVNNGSWSSPSGDGGTWSAQKTGN